MTVEEDAARWARLEAAKKDTSVLRLLGEVIEERMRQEDDYEQAMRRVLRRKPFGKSDGKYPSREELHQHGHIR